MKLEVIVSTMNCESYSELYKQMNLQTDAIIINQESQSVLENQDLSMGSNTVKGYSFLEKGVGLSRNSGLMRSTGDICIMADDDMVYVDGYEEIISKAYEEHPEMDMILFNVRIHQDGKTIEKVKKNGRIGSWNYQRYGAVTFTFKRKSILEKRLSFSLLFGGGTEIGSGEDSLFLSDVLKKKLKVYAVKEMIADVYNDGSSWFSGYNEKYLLDRGKLFRAISPRMYLFLIVQFGIRRRKLFPDRTVKEIIGLMIQGSKR